MTKKINYKYLDNQYYDDGNKRWSVSRLVFLAQDLKPFTIPMKALNVYNIYPKAKSTPDFIKRINRVLDADLSFPIILDEEGYVMDGRNRICKALLENKKTIKAVRFKKNPRHCTTKEKKE